jgi:hypothetical protein
MTGSFSLRSISQHVNWVHGYAQEELARSRPIQEPASAVVPANEADPERRKEETKGGFGRRESPLQYTTISRSEVGASVGETKAQG